MSQRLKAPENLKVTGKDGASLSEWDRVDGAVGYKLQFFDAKDPETCIKSRYAQDRKKLILGFDNGTEYLVRVCAFTYENNNEVRGDYTEKVSFVPKCLKFKAQNTICLKVGESEQIVCEQNGITPAVKYVSETPDVVSVSSSGVVTAKEAGVGHIKITSMVDGQTFRTKIAVERALNSGRGKAVIMLTGDIMCAVRQQRAAELFSYDFNDAFSKIKDTFDRADYVVGVLGTSCYDPVPFEYEQARLKNGSSNSNSPSTFISACANAGFDGLVTANNHNCDAGIAGLEATVEEIKRQGMENFGTLGDNPVVVKVNGIKIGIIACCMVSNGPKDDAGADMLSVVNGIGMYDNDYFVELVNRAKAMGAEYVIAYQHWGKMNSPKTVRSQRETARFMAEAGADLIVGSHPHVVQRFSYIKTESGKRVPCAFSLGNFLTSIREMRENRDGAVLRVELSRENGNVDAKLSYIPCLSEDIEQGTAVVTAFPPHSDESRESFLRTKAALGKQIDHAEYRPTVMISGSSILDRIFKAGKGFRVDKTAMHMSQMSLGSERSFDPPEGSSEAFALEISKDLEGYIAKTCPDFLAVDFYTAATVSCHKIDSVKTEEPCYFTNMKLFRRSEFFARHSYETIRVRPPYGDHIWRPLIKRYAEKVKAAMPHGRVLLFRSSVNSKRFIGSELRAVNAPERRNQLMREMEDLFISIVDPIIIDLSKHYFTQVNNSIRLESEYYADAYNAAVEATSDKGRRCISVPDDELWFDRILKFYDNMTARSYQTWLLDMDRAADKIIARTTKEFAARNRKRLLQIKRAGASELLALRDLFIGDPGAEEVIRAGEIIAVLERGNLSKTYDFFAPAFEGKYNILKTMIRLLSAELGIPVNEGSVEMVFLLRGKPQFQRYIATINHKTIDIWGSCVSRESINRCKDAFVGKYIFKQAPLLAYEPPIDIEFPDGADDFCGSYWRRRTIRDAFNRNGFDLLEGSEAHWIMIDFYDLICTMADYNGDLFELDDFIRRTDFYKGIKSDCRECYLFEKRDMQYCFETITRFAQDIYDQYEDNIILLKTEPKDSYITIDGHLKEFENEGMFDIKRKFISLCEERFSSVTGCYIIDISKHFYSSDKFPLGGAHIAHYEEEFYRQTAEYISTILNGTGKKIFSTVDEDYLLLRSLKLNREN